jgi:murein DD-endopeptidase MepM/ murein hydrolase activator NlpD
MKRYSRNVDIGLILMGMSVIGMLTTGCGQRQDPPAPVSMATPLPTKQGGSAHLPSILVKAGDSVERLAQRYHVTPREIIALNRLTPPYYLRKGQKVLLPQRTMGGGGFKHSYAKIATAKTATIPTGGARRAFPSEPPRPGQVTVVPLAQVPSPPQKEGKDEGQKTQQDLSAKTKPSVLRQDAFDTHGDVDGQGDVENAVSQGDNLLNNKRFKTIETVQKKQQEIQQDQKDQQDQKKQKELMRKNNPLKEERTRTSAIAKEEAASDRRLREQTLSPNSEGAESSVFAQLEKTISTSKKAPYERFSWPLKGKILKRFGTLETGFQNDGINIQAKEGDPIQCAEDGVVAYVGDELQGFGNLVMVKHRNGWMSAYAHCSETLVKRGDKVKRGTIIAKVGHTGNVRTPQLHFELRKKTKAVDPLAYLE